MNLHTREPRDYAAACTLRDGATVLLRAVRPSDRALIADLFARLSPDSIRSRWFISRRGLTDEELRRLVELDFVDDVALAAVLEEGGEEHVVAVGRYCRAATKTRAELAFVVADEHQGRGIGTLLLEHLTAIARASGIEELEADVLAGNGKMLEVFGHSGLPVRKSLDTGVYHLRFSTGAR